MSLYSIETYGELHPGLEQEWLLTNGMGGFASSTVVGCNTRRYHGLLCAATLPPVGRVMLLNRIGEILKIDGAEELKELSVNCFRNSIHPQGYRFLRKFELGNTARWHFEIGDVTVTKEVQILWRQNITGIRYTIDPGTHSVELNLLPFVSLRDFHAERHGTGNLQTQTGHHHVAVRDGDLRVNLRCDEMNYLPEPDWWTGHIYPIETERGQDDTEDLFKPGMFETRITKPTTVTLWASVDEIAVPDWEAELKKHPEPAPQSKSVSSTIQRLARAANDFIVARKAPDGSPGVTVIAGYPWFADWGRDTMISLPGLFLTTGRFAEAGQVLSCFGQYVSDGMIPNRFDDYTNEPQYNTVDASLWFIHACYEYRRASGDEKLFTSKLLPACKQIIEGYSRGTRYHIKMDPADGLISQGDRTTQLTWMDAKWKDVVFTPRQGKAVEINALWYNALMLMGERGGERNLAEKVRASFIKTFWISPFRGLCDCVDGTNRDMSIRPNQIFAASLPHSPLSEDQQHAVVEVVRRELLTPMGLRTLAASDPKYQPKYSGDQFHRDQAYHNGTIWPWPMGAFLDAYLRVHNKSPESVEQAKAWLAPLIEHLSTTGCIGSISEIFEAEPPHRPVGACAQAWSVAEVLRLAVELGM